MSSSLESSCSLSGIRMVWSVRGLFRQRKRWPRLESMNSLLRRKRRLRMAIEFPHYDKLPQGTGYQGVQCPTDDAAPSIDLGTTLPMDSHNDVVLFSTVSIPTQAVDAPTNPAPYWNSGESETLKILEP